MQHNHNINNNEGRNVLSRVRIDKEFVSVFLIDIYALRTCVVVFKIRIALSLDTRRQSVLQLHKSQTNILTKYNATGQKHIKKISYFESYVCEQTISSV